LLSTDKDDVEIGNINWPQDAPKRGERMLTSFILMLIKLLSSPVLVAALAKFLANALKTVS
jgi:hypothetical protein